MIDSIKCWFKRELGYASAPFAEWEEGTAYGFVPEPNSLGQAVIVSAKNDGETLVIPIKCVAFTSGNPDDVKEAYEKTEAKKEAAAKALAAKPMIQHADPLAPPAVKKH